MGKKKREKHMRRIISVSLFLFVLILSAAAGASSGKKAVQTPEPGKPIELENYFGASLEELKSAFPDGELDEFRGQFYVYENTNSVTFFLGRKDTCKEIELSSPEYRGDFTLHGIAPGMTKSEVVNVFGSRKEKYKDIGYSAWALPDLARDYLAYTVFFNEYSDKVAYIRYEPEKYREKAVVSKYGKQPYSGPDVTPADEYDLVQYLGKDIKKVSKQTGWKLLENGFSCFGSKIIFKNGMAEYTLENGNADIRLETGIYTGKNTIYNTKYITRMSISIINSSMIDLEIFPYSIAGLRPSMTQREADAYLDSLDPEISKYLTFTNHGYDNTIRIDWFLDCQFAVHEPGIDGVPVPDTAELTETEKEAAATLQNMTDLDQLIGASQKELMAAFPSAYYDSRSGVFDIPELSGQDNESIDLKFGEDLTCTDVIWQTADPPARTPKYKLHGFALGMSLDETQKLMEDGGERFVTGEGWIYDETLDASSVNGSGKITYIWYHPERKAGIEEE